MKIRAGHSDESSMNCPWEERSQMTREAALKAHMAVDAIREDLMLARHGILPPDEADAMKTKSGSQAA